MSCLNHLSLMLAGLVFLTSVTHAQVTVQKTIIASNNVPDNGTLYKGFTWSSAGLSAIDSVAVTLNMSSPFTSNPIDLTDLSGSIRHGSSSEAFRTGSLFSAGQMTSLSQSFTVASALDGSWLPSNYWRLDITDNQGGGIAKLDTFTFSVTGTAAGSGTLDVGAGGTISASGAGTQEIGAEISSSGSGADAVALEAGDGKALHLNGGIKGAGEFRKQGSGSLRLNSVSLGFTGTMKVESGEVEYATAGALGTGTMQMSGGAKLRVANGLTLSNALAVASGRAELVAASNAVSTIGGAITGSGGLQKTGAGTTFITGTNNTFTGATDVSEGELVVNGNIASSSKVTVEEGGTLSGSGTVGVLEIASGGTLAVGNSPGTLNAGNTTWAGGGGYEWEINNFLGSSGTNWDFLNITGTLDITATSGNKFLIDVVSLLANNNPGEAENFDAYTNYSFAIATASGGITGFDAAKFTLSTGNFANNFYDGAWSLSTSSGGGSTQSLMLSYTGATAIPEPSSAALVLVGLGVAFLKRKRRG